MSLVSSAVCSRRGGRFARPIDESESSVGLIKPGMVAEYRMDEGSGAILHNSVAATGGGNLTLTGSPAWVAGGVDFQGSGDRFATGSFPSTALSTMSAYVAFKWPSAATGDTSNAGLFCGDNINVFRIKPFWANPHAPDFWFKGQVNGAAASPNHADIKDNAWHVLCGIYDGTDLRFYIDDLLVKKTAATLTSVTLTQLTLAGLNASGFSTDCVVGYALLYNTAHTTEQVKNNREAIGNIMAGRGVQMDVHQTPCVQVGDSISFYVDVSLWNSLTTRKLYINRAVPGSGIAGLEADAANVDELVHHSRTNTLVVWGCGNNITSSMTQAQVLAVVDSLDAYLLARRAAGWDRIVLVNLLPRNNANFLANRAVFNPALKLLTSYDVLADVAADATIGPDAAASNVTYYSDGTHLTTAANNIAGPIIAAAVEGEVTTLKDFIVNGTSVADGGTVNVGHEILDPTFTITPLDSAATVSAVTVDSPLAVGDNTATFSVTGADGVTVQNYSITVHRLTAGTAEVTTVDFTGMVAGDFATGSVGKYLLFSDAGNRVCVWFSVSGENPPIVVGVNYYLECYFGPSDAENELASKFAAAIGGAAVTTLVTGPVVEITDNSSGAREDVSMGDSAVAVSVTTQGADGV